MLNLWELTDLMTSSEALFVQEPSKPMKYKEKS